jgi:N-carbamoylputrescine amidase
MQLMENKATDRVRLGICQAEGGLAPHKHDPRWTRLAEKARKLRVTKSSSVDSESDSEGVDVFLLHELPFSPWFVSQPEVDPKAFEEAVESHKAAQCKLSDLGAPFVLGSMADIDEVGRRINQAFLWTSKQPQDIIPVHSKQFMPNHEGFYEARWFSRGDRHFNLAEIKLSNDKVLKVGFLLCTEIMFNEWARWYGRQGAHLIVCPRATGASQKSYSNFSTALKMAALVSGCYVASSNRVGNDNGVEFGGWGMVFRPDGELLACTNADDEVLI